MYSLLGWLNVVILGILVIPFILKFLNKNIIKSKSNKIKNTIKFLRRLHKPLGISLAFIALIHGYLALGSLRLHTGSILYVSIIITAFLGGSFYKLKKRILLIWHRIFALISIFFFLLHFFYPNAIYYLLN